MPTPTQILIRGWIERMWDWWVIVARVAMVAIVAVVMYYVL